MNNIDNYSKAVFYRINGDEMTVEQFWEIKKLGSEYYSAYIEGLDYLNKNNYLINFGGIISDDKVNRYVNQMIYIIVKIPSNTHT